MLRLGHSATPVVVYDTVFADPAAIVEAAARLGRFALPAAYAGGYPGPQSPAPAAYAEALVAAVDSAFAALFGSGEGTVGDLQCRFSLVTLPAAQLQPRQTVPHVDLAREDRFAVLHYLCGPPFAGTAFYRQEATGLERVAAPDWDRLRDMAAPVEGLAPAYPCAATPGYVQIGEVPAAMNRVIAYPSNLLHSGLIPPGPDYSSDPRRGRLTGNLFARYRVAAAPVEAR